MLNLLDLLFLFTRPMSFYMRGSAGREEHCIYGVNVALARLNIQVPIQPARVLGPHQLDALTIPAALSGQ
jgi:hypothetical protein